MSQNNSSNIYHGHLAKIVEAADAGDISSVHSLTNDLLTVSRAGGDLSDSLITNLQQVHCRSLIGLSRYDDVLRFSDSLIEKDSNNILFLQERAYALYKLGRYSKCRDTIVKALKDRTLNRDAVRGLEHILAQCYFRLNETENAVQLYSDLVGDAKTNDNEGAYVVTNAMAALVANNAATTSCSSFCQLQNTVMKLLDDAESLPLVEYPYEMVYNYATLLLQTSTSMKQTQNALKLLATAEEKCMAISKEKQDEESIANDLFPIQSNMALGKVQSGDVNGGLRSYTELASSLKKQNANNQEVTSGKISFVVDNNIASIHQQRGSSVSAFDLLKKIPDPFISSMVKDGEPFVNPYQIRILLYNRAILFFQLQKMAEMKSTLESLKKSLSMDSPINKQGGTNSKKNKKPTGGGGCGGNAKGSLGGKFNAVPTTQSEKLLWRCRIALLENEVSNNHEKLGEIQNAIDIALKGSDISDFEKKVLDCAQAEIQLYKAQKNIGDKNEKMSDDVKRSLIANLKDLPNSIKTRPATVASLCSLYRSMNMNDEIELCLKASSQSGILRKNLAAFKLRLGMYDDAAMIYESILGSNSDLCYEDKVECQAGLIKSLSHIDIEKTIELAKEFGFLDDDGDDDLSVNGEDLEAIEIPRLGKGSKGSSHLRHILISRKQERKQSNKHSKDSILRRRARKRDVYLEKMQKEGKYNPDRPTKPDPERWVPKNQRSYNRRGRKGRNKFLGAQGGGTGFGAEKEAAKLDAYARAAAKAAGKDLTNGKPSTAHLAVSSNNRRRR
mmetsp:Transcript_10674/g.19947  ORF Transcript_10674/g.19947 Transcript_10674/m.19947 type:complete len:785 (+) Transcript_10674:114-2468(+)